MLTKSAFVLIATFFLFLPVTGQATTLLHISGDEDAELLRPGDTDGLALVFDLAQDVEQMSVSIPTLCLNGTCDVEIYLLRRNVFDGIGFASLIDASASSGGGTMTPFSGLDLAAGVYSLVVVGRGGFFGWLGDQPPVTSATPFASVVAVGAIETLNPGTPPASTWVPFSRFVPGVTLEGRLVPIAPAPVPLPATGFMLAMAGGALMVLRRRRDRQIS